MPKVYSWYAGAKPIANHRGETVTHGALRIGLLDQYRLPTGTDKTVRTLLEFTLSNEASPFFLYSPFMHKALLLILTAQARC